MQNVKINLFDVVDHGVEHSEDYGKVSVCVEVTLDNNRFYLTYQSTENENYEPTNAVGLNSSADDDKESLQAMFDFVDDDGDKISGEYSQEYENIEALARAVAQEAFDEFFASMEC
ncbi:MAG: hypothetical protein RBR77_04260 [Thauera sp.]|jgi:hypothetical protein|nr:hypothetical protein [Thauera sp.]